MGFLGPGKSWANQHELVTVVWKIPEDLIEVKPGLYLNENQNTLYITRVDSFLMTYIMASQLWFCSFLENASHITQACVEMLV